MSGGLLRLDHYSLTGIVLLLKARFYHDRYKFDCCASPLSLSGRLFGACLLPPRTAGLLD